MDVFDCGVVPMILVTRSSLSKGKFCGGFAAGLAIVPYYNKPSKKECINTLGHADASDHQLLSITFQGVWLSDCSETFVWLTIQILSGVKKYFEFGKYETT